ncbi:hypothetical protein [Eleftheria terrae]|uniref:hypothetical protein n=1 Tax=Eleftheria terrae TaxID=1597781 RepID=UPI00263A734F|nr:hypothetical protein [Eleftheria terrae]WKB53027.1 hypothetical protein N7L95_01070 [Eleftheria terrae]
MRQDQFDALQERAEQLIDLFIEESDPQAWPGAGLQPAKMDKQTRGDRYWCKKDAVATLACAQRIVALVDQVRQKTAGGDDSPAAVSDGEDELDKEVAEAEAQAQALMDKVAREARKREFDRRVHGKP